MADELENAEAPKLWERQPGETAVEYRFFCLFRDTHPVLRSYERIARETDLSIWQAKRLGGMWGWVDRVLAWDMEQHRVHGIEQQVFAEEVGKQEVYGMTISALRTIREIARVAYSDLRHVAEWGADGALVFTPSGDISEDAGAAIQEIAVEYSKDGRVARKKVKLYDKLKALELLGKIQKLWETEDKGQAQAEKFLLLLHAINAGKLDEFAERVTGQKIDAIEAEIVKKEE